MYLISPPQLTGIRIHHISPPIIIKVASNIYDQGWVSAGQEVMGMEEIWGSRRSFQLLQPILGISDINHGMQSDHQCLINLSYWDSYWISFGSGFLLKNATGWQMQRRVRKRIGTGLKNPAIELSYWLFKALGSIYSSAEWDNNIHLVATFSYHFVCFF